MLTGSPTVDGAGLAKRTAAQQLRLEDDVSAPAALQAIARGCIAQIKAQRPSLGARSPEALHQVRVALRRWRTALAVFRSLLTDNGRKLQAELKWLAGELDEARDLDVLAPSLEQRGP